MFYVARLGFSPLRGVAIDGSKFKAVNARDQNYTEAKMKSRMAQIEKGIAKYLDQLASADRQPADIAEARVAHLTEKIEGLKREMKRLEKIEAQRLAAPDGQISLTDPDSRSMMTSGRGSGMVGYNVQSAVDAETHLIVAHEVTNLGYDRGQLTGMAKKARTAIGCEDLEAIADRGYYKGEDIYECEQAGITPCVPKPLTSGSKKAGRFGKQDFAYIAEDDEYLCPANKRLPKRHTTEERGLILSRYYTSSCHSCSIKDKCTTGKERRITRWEHEDVLEAMQHRLDKAPEKMRTRRETVEHPFGTIKFWMGAVHFLMKGMKKVATEMSMHVLAYNMKRVINMIGIKPLLKAIQA